SFLLGTHDATLVGGQEYTNFEAQAAGTYQEYGGSGGGVFVTSPTSGGMPVHYAIHGAAGARNDLLVYQGDDPAVTANALALRIRSAGVPDDSDPTKEAVAVDASNDNGPLVNFVIPNGLANLTVLPRSA